MTETMKHLYDKQLLSIKQLSDDVSSPKTSPATAKLEQPKEENMAAGAPEDVPPERKKSNIVKG